MFEQVSCVIPGASRVEQVISNVEAASLEDLSQEDMKRVRDIYEEYIKESVHHLW